VERGRTTGTGPVGSTRMSRRPVRFLDRGGRVLLPQIGLRADPLRDAYFRLLRMRWRSFVALLFLAYLALTAAFAGLYALDPHAIRGVRDGSLADVFFFSVETFATIGYGTYAPQSLYGHVLVTVEAFVGMLGVALAAGLAFAKFSRATARVLFSDRAVVSPFDGQIKLMIRLANARESEVAEAQLRLTLVRDETTREGVQMRRFHELRLERQWSPVFALTWTVFHPIDEASPLRAATSESLRAENAEVVVSFSGMDLTLGQTVHARRSYGADEIVWNARLADVIEEGGALGRRVNYARLHDVVPVDVE
jgi:inward rectifier potassium channel